MKIVRVKNIGSIPFKGRYDGEDYTVAPGSESLVPYDSMVLWAGDPTARNVNDRNKNRTQEYNRLRTKYGAYENEVKWEANRPQIEFYTMDGDRIYTVMDDPDGDKVNPNLVDAQSNATVAAQLETLQAQMGQMLDMIATGKLVLADTTGSDDAALQQMGADAEEARLVPGPVGPLTVSSPSTTLTPDASNDAPLGDDDGSATVSGLPANAVPPGDGPPTDSPKSVKIGGRKPAGSPSSQS